MSNKINVSGKALAEFERAHMHDTQFDAESGECLKYQRMNVQALGGHEAWPVPQGLNAAQVFHWFKARGEVLPASTPLRPGDFVFKDASEHMPQGHVACFVGGVNLAENASTRIGRVRGAIGFRTLQQFGHFDGVVRPARP